MLKDPAAMVKPPLTGPKDAKAAGEEKKTPVKPPVRPPLASGWKKGQRA